MAGKDGDARKIVAEAADLWFHSLVALAQFGITPAQVLAASIFHYGTYTVAQAKARMAERGILVRR